MKRLSKRKRVRLRYVARREYMKTLTTAFDLCIYCGDIVVWKKMLAKLKAVKIIESDYHNITFEWGGDVSTFKLATVEHKVPLAKGGRNAIGNLAAACLVCNWEMSRNVVRTTLSDRDRDALLAMLDADEEPSEGLREAAEIHKRLVTE